MHPLWKVLNLTSSFRYNSDIWTVIENGDDTIEAQNERTRCIDPFNPYCLVEPCGIDMGMETAKDIARRLDNQQFVRSIRALTSKYGWHNTAKVLREVVSVHVGWDSAFTELDNVLRRIEQDFDNSCRPDLERNLLAQRERDRSDIEPHECDS